MLDYITPLIKRNKIPLEYHPLRAKSETAPAVCTLPSLLCSHLGSSSTPSPAHVAEFLLFTVCIYHPASLRTPWPPREFYANFLLLDTQLILPCAHLHS